MQLITNIFESLRVCLQMESPLCYTDSQVTLCWINGRNKDWKPFVQNRNMQTCTNHLMESLPWKGNPADLPSCGLLPEELSDNSLWFMAPSLLRDKTSAVAEPQLSDKARVLPNCVYTPPAKCLDC